MVRIGSFVLAACAVWLLLFSDRTMQAASQAAGVFVTGVMPALFPMMVLSRLMPSGGSMVLSALFGLASGSPAAAQRLKLLQDSGLPSARAEKLAVLTGVMSPMFFTGTLARWTGSARNGWMLLAVHWTAALITMLVWRTKGEYGAADILPQQSEEPLLRRLPAAVGQAAQAMLAVCGAMMLFSIASALVRAGLEAVFPAWTRENARGLAVLWALMEIGGGSSAVVQAWEDPPLALLAALCSFGGLSIWMQNLLFVGQSIRPARLLWMRMLHGAIAYGLGLMLF